jgi:hypothetical protein
MKNRRGNSHVVEDTVYDSRFAITESSTASQPRNIGSHGSAT